MFSLFEDEDSNEASQFSNELDNLEASIVEADQKLDSIEAIGMSIESSGEVYKSLMVKLQTLEPEVISPQYPISSYTDSPSEQNLHISLEASTFGIALSRIAIIAIIAVWIANMFAILASRDSEKRTQTMRIRYDNIHIGLRDSKAGRDKVRKEFDVSRLYSGRYLLKGKSPVITILKLMQSKSNALKMLSKWKSKYVSRIEMYVNRIDVLIGVIKKSKKADDAEAKKLIDILHREEMDQNDELMKDMVELKSIFAQSDNDMLSIDDLIKSKEYLEFLEDYKSWEDGVKLFTNSKDSAKLDKLFKTTSTKTTELKSVSKDFADDIKDKTSAKVKNGESITSVKSSGSNVELVKQINASGKELKAEASAIMYLYKKYDAISKFYVRAMDDILWNAKKEKAAKEKSSKS